MPSKPLKAISNARTQRPAGPFVSIPGGRAPLPEENGRPRVQRLVEHMRPVHLELAPPESDPWVVTVTGLVEYEVSVSIGDLRGMGVIPITVDFHCVWGWSRPAARWAGVPTDVLLQTANPEPSATHVRFASIDGVYASCVPLEQARDGLLALELDGESLARENGGPLRWLQPDYLWGYKGVKWLGSIELLDAERPGPWETLVGDTEGRVPEGILQRFEDLRVTDSGSADKRAGRLEVAP